MSDLENEGAAFRKEIEAELERHSGEITRIMGAFVMSRLARLFTDPAMFKVILDEQAKEKKS